MLPKAEFLEGLATGIGASETRAQQFRSGPQRGPRGVAMPRRLGGEQRGGRRGNRRRVCRGRDLEYVRNVIGQKPGRVGRRN